MAYYDDDYRIHYSEKNRSGWFPQKPHRRRSICIMSRQGRLNNIKFQREIRLIDRNRGRYLSS